MSQCIYRERSRNLLSSENKKKLVVSPAVQETSEAGNALQPSAWPLLLGWGAPPRGTVLSVPWVDRVGVG